MVEFEFPNEHFLPKSRNGRFIAAFLMAAMGHTEDEIKEELFPELLKHWPTRPTQTTTDSPQPAQV